jgi:hypothetical protein
MLSDLFRNLFAFSIRWEWCADRLLDRDCEQDREWLPHLESERHRDKAVGLIGIRVGLAVGVLGSCGTAVSATGDAFACELRQSGTESSEQSLQPIRKKGSRWWGDAWGVHFNF